MTNLPRDFRFAFRLLWQNKSFTAIAVLALALGVGPNTAIFSVIYATLYAPIPYPHADQLVMVWSKLQGNRGGVAAGDFLDWQSAPPPALCFTLPKAFSMKRCVFIASTSS